MANNQDISIEKINRDTQLLKEKLGLFFATDDPLKRKQIYKNIYFILNQYGYIFSKKEYNPLSLEERLLVRIDFNGFVVKPADCPSLDSDEERPMGCISVEYQKFKESKNRKNRKIYREDEYIDLCMWPLWKTCEKSENFKSIKPRVISYLAENSIPPSMLESLTINDFNDILYEAFCEEGREKASLFEGKRTAFIKYLAKNYRNDIKKLLIEKDIPKSYARLFISKMEKFGASDINTGGYDLDVHHIEPIGASCKSKNIFALNDPKKLCLIVNSKKFPLHKIINIFNAVNKGDEGWQIVRYLSVPENAKIIMGLDKASCVFDMGNENVQQCQKTQAAKSRNSYANDDDNDVSANYYINSGINTDNKKKKNVPQKKRYKVKTWNFGR